MQRNVNFHSNSWLRLDTPMRALLQTVKTQMKCCRTLNFIWVALFSKTKLIFIARNTLFVLINILCPLNRVQHLIWVHNVKWHTVIKKLKQLLVKSSKSLTAFESHYLLAFDFFLNKSHNSSISLI